LEVQTASNERLRDQIRLPSEDNKWLSFNNYCRKKRVSFIVYADLKCILEKMEKSHIYQHYRVE